jgi:Sulfotransferase family
MTLSADTPIVFLIGSSRSGTTWLQRMLGNHPEIASPQESDLFSRYVPALFSIWQSQLPGSHDEWARMRYKGLPALLTREEFIGTIRDWSEDIYQAPLAGKPSARIILDKNPEYSLSIRPIREIFPAAKFIHLIRDGRDVAVSLRRIAAGWGNWWAPSGVAAAARRWRDYVHGGRAAADAPGRYLELRYEDLTSGSGAVVLKRAFEFCGTQATDEFCRDLIGAYSRESTANVHGGIVWGGEALRRVGGEPPEPKGFVGEGSEGSWRDVFTASDRYAFDRVAGSCLVELGYERDRQRAASSGLVRIGAVTAEGVERLLDRSTSVKRARLRLASGLRSRRRPDLDSSRLLGG